MSIDVATCGYEIAPMIARFAGRLPARPAGIAQDALPTVGRLPRRGSHPLRTHAIRAVRGVLPQGLAR